MRFPPVAPNDMTPAQRDLASSYRTGWRTTIANADGSLGGPFDATLRSPELAGRLGAVSNYFRDGTALPPRLNELAILVVARHWDSDFEWHAHCAAALDAGLAREVVDGVNAGHTPAGMRADEAIVFEVATELQSRHRLSDATFERARSVLGERQLIDLVGVCGYYTLVAMMLATADVHPASAPREGVPSLAARQP
ncbi:MAG TPA: carboxymuconolactone decarboxylase family protein [Ramlibacter sp.]|uniref:carboxymuconolactone decarboxylase family protein n=1 Tax=Ramlibacter sp. TaxID=1917967 RepID=UPI002D1234E3|nr:carboxymuconolactone decarboxylase family protein [Ramlibacter sp.]HVZ45251.1 carboxymuconolactone decarboxylase family protein [Ramlibacter sp.]